MSEKLRGPEGSTHAQVDGIDYEIGEDGLFEVDNPDHVAILRCMGFIGEAEAGLVDPTIFGRWPHVATSMVNAGVNLTTVTTAEQILDIFEAKAVEQLGPFVPEPVEPAPVPEPDPQPEPVPVVTEPSPEQPTPLPEPTEDPAGDPEAPAEETAPTGEATQEAPAGDDTIAGGAGEDTIAGTDTGTDTVSGDIGNDTIAGGAGEDEVFVNPAFTSMNRSGIHAWLVANGGTELTPSSSKDDLVTAAETRADELSKKE
jgi:Ca2+-binding RTX toxin-like protein